MLTRVIQVYDPASEPKGCTKDQQARHELIASRLHDALFRCLNDLYVGWPTPKDNWSTVFLRFMDTTITRNESGICVMHITRYHDGEPENNLMKTKRNLFARGDEASGQPVILARPMQYGQSMLPPMDSKTSCDDKHLVCPPNCFSCPVCC